MLCINHSKDAGDASRYFKDSLSVNDYYGEKKEITGTWHGQLAERVGLSGDVGEKDFEALLMNVDPRTGKQMTARNSAKRRPMYDFTFNAPKSVSLVHAITGDKDILSAHGHAVLKTMEKIEADMQTQSGTGKRKHYVTTGNMAFAEFIHTTTRPIKIVASDTPPVPEPHLHSHCAVMNMTWFEKQKKYRAIEIGNIKAQGAYYEALYHSYMGERLKELGYGISQSGKRWEIAGIDRNLIEKFSSRTLQIEELARQRGIKSEKAKAQLGRMTRNSKNGTVHDGVLRKIWVSRLTDTEYQSILSAKANGKKTQGQSSAACPPCQTTMTAERLVDHALDHCLERHSAISEKKLLAYAIDQSCGEVRAEAIRNELAGRSNIMSAVKNTVRYITTVEMENEENRLIERAVQGKKTCVPLNPYYQINSAYLNEGQRAAISYALASEDAIAIISGDAGVGKTTLLQEVKRGVEAVGKSLLAFAPSSDASRFVLRSKGFDEAETVAMLLNSQRLQERLQDNVMLIDEAGLIGVPTMNKLLDIAAAKNARVILSGDWKQHSAVERGDALKILETKSGLQIARVTEILRQRGKKLYRQIIERIAKSIGVSHKPEYRKKEVAKAFDMLDQGGNIIEIADRAIRDARLAKEYLRASAECHSDVITVAPTHAEGQAITSQIREALRAHGRLDRQERIFTRLKSKNFTGAQKQNPKNYVSGQIIEFHQNASGFKAGQRYVVSTVSEQGEVLVRLEGDGKETPLLLQEHQKFGVYEQENIGLSVSDRLRITKNCKSLAGAYLFNGQVYDIRGFDDDGNIALSNGEVLVKDAGHFNLGYVTTSHASQGKDARTVLIAQSTQSFAASNDKQFYVSVSRGAENCFIFTDDKAALKEAVCENGDQMSAQDIAEAASKERETHTALCQISMACYRLKGLYDSALQIMFQKKAGETHGRENQDQLGNSYHQDAGSGKVPLPQYE